MPPAKPAVAELHRSTIVAAAKALFAEKGFGATTMDDVARAAGYSKRTVYVYVTSKDDIQNAIVLEGFTGLLDRLRRVAETPGRLADALGAVCDHLVALHGSEPYVFVAMMGHRAADPPGGTDPVLARLGWVDDELDAIVRGIVSAAQARGEIDAGIDPGRAAFALWAELVGLVSLAIGKEAYLRRRLDIGVEEFLTESVAALALTVTGVAPDA